MIRVKNLAKDKEGFYINPAMIEIIENRPDTIISLINGKKYIVGDTIEELLASIEQYYKIVGMISPKVTFNSYDFSGVEDYL